LEGKICQLRKKFGKLDASNSRESLAAVKQELFDLTKVRRVP
jgi:hypothetical protein